MAVTATIAVLFFSTAAVVAQPPFPTPPLAMAADGADRDRNANANANVAELWTGVSIVRDAWGVPHIDGDTDEALIFGFGYAQAEDHWRAMLTNFYMATGRMAEVFGDGPSPLAQTLVRVGAGPAARLLTNSLVDGWVKAFGIPDAAAANFSAFPIEIQRMATAFAAGINVYLAELAERDERPEWAEDITGVEIMAFAQFISFSRTLEFLGTEPLNFPQDSRGSNMWALAPPHSTTGHVMFHMDPHLELTGISQWYEAHLKGPTFDVRGATFFGLPMVVMGFSENIVWSMTRNRPDVVDIYRERINPDNRDQYFDPTAIIDGNDNGDGAAENGPNRGAFVPFRIREIRVKVKQRDGSLRETVQVQRYTRNGPVLPMMVGLTAGPGYCYSARSALLEAQRPERGGFFGQLLGMARAKTLPEFKTALALQQIPLWNIMAGTSAGDIFYVFNAYVPKRKGDFDYTRPVPGYVTDADWQGFYSFEELPQIENPPSGWLQNCNNHPNYSTVNTGEIAAPTFDVPTDLCLPRLTGRALRAREILSTATAAGRVDPATFLTWGLDVFLPPAEIIVPMLLAHYDAHEKAQTPAESAVAHGMERLRTWDRCARADSVAACHWLTWYMNEGRRLAGDNAFDENILGKNYLGPIKADAATLFASYAAHLSTFAERIGRIT